MGMEVEVVEDGPDRLRIVAHYRKRVPHEVYRDWVEPERIRAWWGPEATVDLEVGGEYVFRWTQINAVLRGKYTRIEADRRLEFGWAWDDEPERAKQVSLSFRSDGGTGTFLEVIQGPYSADERDQELRHQHLDGWRIHLPRLESRPPNGSEVGT
jgi:uncharacterized protein YndB with AHSA1/START domain